ncbi:MAG TPA: tol-pal system protein YbgF [Thermoanaerobaculia bacterium]|nr:tol-pal system protein YbgF [Thermoanaerobaculia bacterium]
MKKIAAAAFLVLAAACASTDTPEPLPPVTPAPDPRIGELQTSLTELLERIDVLNERMARLENGVAAAPAPAAPAAAPMQSQPASVAARPQQPPQQQVLAADELQPAPSQPALASAKLAEDYRQAIILFGRGRHADARRAFQEVFEADSNGDLADNALYWIGETYYAARDYTNAVRFYMRVVNDYAEENKAPDALLKVALSQERTGDLALARKTLQRVIERYPYSSTASTAKSELQRIRY